MCQLVSGAKQNDTKTGGEHQAIFLHGFHLEDFSDSPFISFHMTIDSDLRYDTVNGASGC